MVLVSSYYLAVIDGGADELVNLRSNPYLLLTFSNEGGLDLLPCPDVAANGRDKLAGILAVAGLFDEAVLSPTVD